VRGRLVQSLFCFAKVVQTNLVDGYQVIAHPKPRIGFRDSLRIHQGLIVSSIVSTELAQALSIVSLNDGKIVGQIPTGAQESHMFVRTPDGRKTYTVNLHAGSISVLDVRARRLVKVIPVSKLLNRIALSLDGKWLFATDGASPNVVMIDTATDGIVRKIAVAAAPFSIAPSPDCRWLLAGETSATAGKLEAIELEDFRVKHSYEVDSLPLGFGCLRRKHSSRAISAGTRTSLS
jgi:YVTN family beta-propeller protein